MDVGSDVELSRLIGERLPREAIHLLEGEVRTKEEALGLDTH